MFNFRALAPVSHSEYCLLEYSFLNVLIFMMTGPLEKFFFEDNSWFADLL